MTACVRNRTVCAIALHYTGLAYLKHTVATKR
jgi:hypothetical protein